MGSEGRRHPRLACKAKADVYLSSNGRPCVAEVRDLSLEGALIVLGQSHFIAVGNSLELAFNINDFPFRVRAQVRSVYSGSSLGLQFEALSARAKMLMELLIETLHKEGVQRSV